VREEEAAELVHTILAHHGVKGQKWGVRRARKKAQKQAIQNYLGFGNQVQVRQHQRRLNATLTEDRYKQLDTHDFVIERGGIVKRTTKSPGHNGPAYVSTNERDATNYRGLVPGWETGGPARTHEGYFEVTMRATQNLRSPSERARVDAYIKLMDANEIKLGNGETINGREYLRRQGLGHLVDELPSRELALRYYGQLVAQQGIKNEPINSAYFKLLEKKGYNALIDDNDRNILSQTPLLVLQPQKSLEHVEVKQLSTDEVLAAMASVKLPD